MVEAQINTYTFMETLATYPANDNDDGGSQGVLTNLFFQSIGTYVLRSDRCVNNK